MSRELSTTLIRALAPPQCGGVERTSPRRSEIERGMDVIPAGKHALVARIVVWLERLTQMSRTRSARTEMLARLALASPQIADAYEMPPNGTLSVPLKWRNWHAAGSGGAEAHPNQLF